MKKCREIWPDTLKLWDLSEVQLLEVFKRARVQWVKPAATQGLQTPSQQVVLDQRPREKQLKPSRAKEGEFLQYLHSYEKRNSYKPRNKSGSDLMFVHVQTYFGGRDR